MNVRPDEAALFVQHFLRHPDFRTHQQRLGRVVRVYPAGIAYWERGKRRQVQTSWHRPIVR